MQSLRCVFPCFFCHSVHTNFPGAAACQASSHSTRNTESDSRDKSWSVITVSYVEMSPLPINEDSELRERLQSLSDNCCNPKRVDLGY